MDKLAILVMTLALTGCGGDNGIKVESRDYGESWPLNVQSAVLKCDPPNIARIEVNDIQYALNGGALRAGFPRLDPILKDKNIVSTADFTQKALALCDSKK